MSLLYGSIIATIIWIMVGLLFRETLYMGGKALLTLQYSAIKKLQEQHGPGKIFQVYLSFTAWFLLGILIVSLWTGIVMTFMWAM